MIKSFLNDRRIEKILNFLPYFDLAYFPEIIYMMIFMYFIYGKVTAIFLGITFFVILSFLIYSIFFRTEKGRKIQIFWLDIHIASTIPFIFFEFIRDSQLSVVSILLIIFRFIMFVMEILYLYLLTDINIKSSQYN